ncbi:MAG: hypothetical protein ACK5C5_03385 [Bacteroidota bacterium]
MKVFCLMLAFFYLPELVKAQTPKSFTHQNEKFLEEMQAFLSLTNKKDAEELIDRFEPLWMGAAFNNQQRERVFYTCDAMLKKRLKPFPDFFNYLNSLVIFAESKQSPQRFDAWHNGIDILLSGSSRNFSILIGVCNGLFQGGYLFESSAVKWRSTSLDYTFEQDSIPKIGFKSLDLICVSKGDSLVISKTSGFLYPTLKKFVGSGGKVTWERAGLAADQVYADLSKFSIDLSGSDYDADSAVFHNKSILDQPLVGRVSDKLLVRTDSSSVSYPRFRSYNGDLEIKQLIKDAQYTGGFSMHGSKIIGSGTKSKNASLIFKRNNIPFLIASAQGFVIRKDRVVSDNASVKFIFEKDSIYHPGVEFKYLNETKTITITRPTQRTIGTPFSSSFHSLDMYFDQLTWKVDDPLMYLKMSTAGEEVKLVFESKGYFRNERYLKIQGINDLNPLVMIKQFAEKNQTRDVGVAEYSAFMKMNDTQIRSLIMTLSTQGFVTYNSNSDRFLVNDKLYYYISSSLGKSDYDVIEIGSQITSKPNAKINLLNFDIDMEGVPRIVLSDTQRVYIEPREQQVTIKRNRNMSFDGRVRSGRYDFRGREFNFIYDEFKIRLNQIDSLVIRIPNSQPSEDGQITNSPLKSVLQNLTGYLEIDRPDNKSSFKKSPDFPKFTSEGPAYVYYDDPQIYGGVYDRKRFYFLVDPFAVDSLDNFNAGSLTLNGTFVSAGIFPDFKEVLKIQEDRSLGFAKTFDPQGQPLYGGKGRYTNNVSLNYSGLKGDGEISFLGSKSNSDSFIFFPDSSLGTNVAFDLENRPVAGVEFPDAQGSGVAFRWLPNDDKMFLHKVEKDFTLYSSNVIHDGYLVMSSKGLRGSGISNFDKAGLESKDIAFKSNSFSADTSDFRINSMEAGKPALQTNNMKSFVDLKNRFGEFVSNGTGSYVSFPFNKYICFIDRFKWLMDEQNVLFDSKAVASGSKMGVSGAEFISIDPAQDSLRWVSQKALYSLSSYVINAEGVKHVDVADSRISPKDGKLTVGTDALIAPLSGASLVADTSSKFHSISDATIRIRGRRDFSGQGNYDYVDQLKVNHVLKLTQIGVDTAQHTYAIGEIADTLNFQLSPNIQYKGSMRISAPIQSPYFNGFARANHSCETLEKYWFSFAAQINPQGVNIPVVSPVNEEKTPLYSAICLSKDSIGVYGTFISSKKSPTDHVISSGSGLLSFDSKSNSFKISPDTSLKSQTAGDRKKEDPNAAVVRQGSFELDNSNCSFSAFGNVDLATNFGQFKMKTAGKTSFDPGYDSLKFDLMVDLDFFFNQEALKEMVDLILSYSNLQPTNEARPVFKDGIHYFMDDSKAKKFLEETEAYGNPKKLPDELSHSMFLTDLNLIYRKETMSYRSVGNIGVGYIGKIPVNRLMKGYFEIVKRRSGDVFHLYFELDGNTWFYFNYQQGTMQVLSSSLKFNEIINNMKPEKRVADDGGGKAPYQYLLSTERKKFEFIKRFEDRDKE